MFLLLNNANERSEQLIILENSTTLQEKLTTLIKHAEMTDPRLEQKDSFASKDARTDYSFSRAAISTSQHNGRPSGCKTSKVRISHLKWRENLVQRILGCLRS